MHDGRTVGGPRSGFYYIVLESKGAESGASPGRGYGGIIRSVGIRQHV